MSNGFCASTRLTTPAFRLLDGVLGGIVGDDLHLAAEPGIDHRRAGALGAEHVGAEDAGEIRARCWSTAAVCCVRRVRVVEVEVGPEDLDVREFLRHHFLEALIARPSTELTLGLVELM